MFIMKSEDKVGLPRIDRWHPRGKSIVTGLFRRAIQDIAADGKADHLLELLQDPHNVRFEYVPLPCQYDDLPLSSAELIADINTTVDASSAMIPKALIYGIQLDPECLAAASYRKFLFAAGLIPSAESFLASLRASWSLNRVSVKKVGAHKQVEAPPQTVAVCDRLCDGAEDKCSAAAPAASPTHLVLRPLWSLLAVGQSHPAFIPVGYHSSSTATGFLSPQRGIRSFLQRATTRMLGAAPVRSSTRTSRSKRPFRSNLRLQYPHKTSRQVHGPTTETVVPITETCPPKFGPDKDQCPPEHHRTLAKHLASSTNSVNDHHRTSANSVNDHHRTSGELCESFCWLCLPAKVASLLQQPTFPRQVDRVCLPMLLLLPLLSLPCRASLLATKGLF